MPATRDGKTWRSQFYYEDWLRHKKNKRGFKTKAEAEEWERNFRQQQRKDLDINFENFVEIYFADVENRLRESTIKNDRYGDIITKGFTSVDEFVNVANMVLNRRKSRAGKSLEHHLAAIFDGNELEYSAQAVTEGNKKPDFIFPSKEAYHNSRFSVDSLISLAAKTTCKDRWRQVINEADRLKGRPKYLCTLQQGISGAQMDKM